MKKVNNKKVYKIQVIFLHKLEGSNQRFSSVESITQTSWHMYSKFGLFT